MQSAFDITADLDTPVSAYLKLAPFKPRFLLESVEGGERLGRYSFIGFGDSVEFRLTGDTYSLNGDSAPVPSTSEGLLNVLREALDSAPRLRPEIPGLPFTGGLVGTTGFEMNKRFENLAATGDIDAAYMAPKSGARRRAPVPKCQDWPGDNAAGPPQGSM